MKKPLLTLVALIFVTAAISQSIPNGGFESWTTTNFENPQYFFSSNLQNKGNTFNPVNVIKTTDAYHGIYAVQLNTLLSGTDTAGAYLANGDPSKPAGQGIPYNQKPTALRCYYKCNIMPGDTGLIIVYFKLGGIVISQDIKKITGIQNTYTLMTMNLNVPLTPDSLIFAATSSNMLSNNFQGIPGSMLQLDSLTFTGVSSQPLNFNGDFETWQMQSQDKLTGWELSGNQGGSAGNKTTDAYTGALALELITYNNNGSGVSPGNATTGHSVQNGTIGGHPYTQQVDTLDFYYKYVPNDINDSAEVNLEFKTGGIPFANVKTLLPASAIYKHISVPLNLFSVPDSLIVFIMSSKDWNVPPSYVGADLKIDDISFRSQLVPVTSFILPASGCQNQTVQLIDNSSNIPTSYTWTATGGNLTGANTANATVTYTTAGTYTISLITSNSYGSGAVLSQTLAVNATPGMIINGAATICNGQSTVLSGTGASIVTYTWSGGPNAQSYTVSPTSNTTYTLTGTDANGCTNTQTAFLTVNPLPTVTVNSPTICAGNQATLSANGAATYTWNGGPSTQTFVVTPSNTANYTVTGSDGNGCTNTAISTVTVNQIPGMIINGNTTICNGQSTVLSGSGASIVSYTWTAGPASQSYTVSPTANATYTLTGEDANSCVNTQTVSVTVNALPVVTVNSGTICLGQQTTTLSAGGANTYSWSPSTGLSSSSGATVTANPTVTTTYTITGTDNSTNCSSTQTATVMVNPLPVPAVTSNGPICSGQTLNLFSSGGVTFSWVGPNAFSSTQQNPTVINASVSYTGTYTVTVTDANGCYASDTITAVVNGCLMLSNYTENTISIYPNPSNGIFTIAAAELINTIAVFDLTGKKICTFIPVGSRHQVDLTEFKDGVYFLEIITNKSTIRKKITKTN